MHASKYNVVIHGNEKPLLYNSFTNALAELSEYEDVINILENPDSETKDIKKTQLRESLFRGGYITDIDQFGFLKMMNSKIRYSNDNLTLTLMPTNQCNCRCTYCYELDSFENETMTKETQDNLLMFIEKWFTERHGKTLTVTWYGGEPLLAYDVVDSLSEKLLEICKKNDISYKSEMVTNLTLLNEKIISTLKKNFVSEIQVTLDGVPEIHNGKRKYVDGTGTFDDIINNLQKLIDSTDVIIKLRIHVNSEVIESYETLLDILENKGLKNKVYLYLAPLKETNYFRECMSAFEYSDVYFELVKTALNKGWRIASYPNLRFNSCMASIMEGSYLIDAKGMIYKCWDHAGKEDEAIGSINREFHSSIGLTSKEKGNIIKWALVDHFNDKECVECLALPICAGGCPHLRLQNKKKNCLVFKEKIEKNMVIMRKLLKECKRS